jgi:hypothetical protein
MSGARKSVELPSRREVGPEKKFVKSAGVVRSV